MVTFEGLYPSTFWGWQKTLVPINGWFTYKSMGPMKRKESNDLNQTFRELCSMLYLVGLCFFFLKKLVGFHSSEHGPTCVTPPASGRRGLWTCSQKPRKYGEGHSRWGCWRVISWLELRIWLQCPKDPITFSDGDSGVLHHLQNARYLGSITILRRWARIPREDLLSETK